LVDLLLGKAAVVDTPHGQILFLNHSGVSYTIMTKEPDSMQWIDAMQSGSVFWDIGANVGVLTLYAAMRGDLEVWAFEPAAVNYSNLVASGELNCLEKHVRCLQTHEIFAGAKHTLSQSGLKEIQVEARKHGGSGRRISEVLAPMGFKITSLSPLW
jgi:precorrin-6B methylase 2